ncbi:unnamed protein product [Mytilus edulis]|uniref:G-protein coupled receptors family 1 profile domain-containing protein n=1 Tax=Mytilus edulis TaxID=6550 RepID=A0A8S3SI27_MYTED|nr:unnamed protein product [Mytilus edulis]
MAAASDGQSKFDSVRQEMLGLTGTSKQEIKRQYNPRANRQSFPPVSPGGSTDIEQDTQQFNSEDLESKPLMRLEDIRVAVSDSIDETTVKEGLLKIENRTDVTRVKEHLLDQTNGNSGTSDETKVKELSSEQQNMIECTRVNEPSLDQANGNSTAYCFHSTERVVETIVISETSGGPHEMAIQPVNVKLEERVLVLEKDNKLLRESNGLEQKFESLQLRVQKLENENQKLRQSMHFPATVDKEMKINANSEMNFSKSLNSTDSIRMDTIEGFVVITLGLVCTIGNFSCMVLIVCHRKFRKTTIVILCHHCFLDLVKSLYLFPYGYSLMTSLPAPYCNWIGSSYVFIVTTSAYNMMALVVNQDYELLLPRYKWRKIHESLTDEFEKHLDFNIEYGETDVSMKAQRKTILSQLRTTRIFMLIVISFIVFWYPLFILTLGDFHFNVTPSVYRILTIIAWSHPITTPILCSLVLRDIEFKGYTLRDISSNLIPCDGFLREDTIIRIQMSSTLTVNPI